jgi:hypothetical protein
MNLTYELTTADQRNCASGSLRHFEANRHSAPAGKRRLDWSNDPKADIDLRFLSLSTASACRDR